MKRLSILSAVGPVGLERVLPVVRGLRAPGEHERDGERAAAERRSRSRRAAVPSCPRSPSRRAPAARHRRHRVPGHVRATLSPSGLRDQQLVADRSGRPPIASGSRAQSPRRSRAWARRCQSRLDLHLGLEVAPGSPSSASSSWRAAVPASLSTAPPLPITMPFCESRSTRMRHRQRGASRRPAGGRRASVVVVDLHRDRDRVRQLVAGDREQLLAHQLGGEERLGLVGDDAVGVVVRALGQPGLELADERVDAVAGAGRAAARRRRTRRARPAARARCSATVGAARRASILFTTRIFGVVDLRARARRRTGRRGRSARSPRRGGRRRRPRRAWRGRARWCARRAACAACGCPGVSSSTIWLVGGRAHAADLRARRLRPVGDDRRPSARRAG